MAKPITHAISSAKTFGGEPEDYIDIHDFMDSSKGVVGDNRHRVLTHNAWFIGPNGPLEKAFGKTVENSEGSQFPVREVGEQHILEDFKGKFIPTVQDYIQAMDIEDWMQNGQGTPPSDERLEKDREKDPFELAFGDHKEVVAVKLDGGVALETFEYSDHH